MFFVNVVLFFVFGFFFVFHFRRVFLEKRLSLESHVQSLQLFLEGIFERKEKIEKEITALNLILTKTVKMYEAARNICISLDEEKLFSKLNQILCLNHWIHFLEHIFYLFDLFQKIQAKDFLLDLV